MPDVWCSSQVEFYFSDINLATIDQLFRFMSKDPEGYVPLSVVASFKKVKSAIIDNTQLANILRSSNKLPRLIQSIGYLGDTVEEAAYKIAEVENKSFVAAEFVKETERVSRMAEDM